MQIIKLIFRRKWKCLELGNGRERKMFFQSLTKVAWKKKSEYSQQESNLWPSGPGCSKDGYRYPSYKKRIRETNCAIQWIVIYLVDSALDLSNIWRLVISPHAVHWATGDSWKLLFICWNWHISRAHKRLENRRHFATPPTVSPRNDVWEKSAETPYWWHVIWLVLLIGWDKFHKAARPIRSSTQIWVVMRH